jgi:hypothetical protein
MRFVHTTGNSLKQITRVEIRLKTFVQYSEGDYILHMTSRLFVAVHSIALLTLLT